MPDLPPEARAEVPDPRFPVDRRRAMAIGGVGVAALVTSDVSHAAPPWDQLAARLGPRLRGVASPLETCVAAHGAGAEALFGQTLKNPFAITDDPGLTQTLLWQDAWKTASPLRAVRAQSAADIAAAVDFARRNRVPLVTRGGGHSYFGNSNRAEALMVWTQGLQDVTQHDAFVPHGAPAGTVAETAVSLGAGCLWGEVYRQTMAGSGAGTGRYVQGGGCLTVGVAGFTLGGGFGSFSKGFGTGAANLLEAEVVTADGRVRVVNAWNDPELFFGLRGGGGGTFAIATRLTMRTHPLPATVGAMLFEVTAKDDAAWRELVGAAIDHYATHLFNPAWGETIRFTPRRTLTVSMLFQGRTEAEARADWAPLLAWIRQRPERLTLAAEPHVIAAPGRAFFDPEVLRRVPGVVLPDDRPGADPARVFWATNREEAGQQIYAYKSRWLPQALLAPAQRARLADAIVLAASHWPFALHFNKGMAGGDPAAIARTAQTAMNPQVLDAFALAIVAATDEPAWPGIPGHEPDRTEGHHQAARVAAAYHALARIAPGWGSYVSESDWHARDWQRDHWGRNTPRLLAAKRRYDPAGLFTGHHCVGES
jgi:FAD/FMN-containing dehydrogenase